MGRLETLIDNLLIYLPADVPLLVNLIERQEGRYILAGLIVVIALLVVWTLLAILQMMFFGEPPRPKTEKTLPVELSELAEIENTAETEADTDGFSFFKKSQDADIEETGEAPALVAIEQKMLAVRSLYTGGHVIKDVYVSETRRLYAEAQAIKNSQNK